MIPTRRLAFVALLSVAASSRTRETIGNLWWTLALINGLLLGVAMIDLLLAPSARALEITREHPPVVVIGEAAVLGWSVHNASRRRVRMRLADELAPSLRAATRRVSLSRGRERPPRRRRPWDPRDAADLRSRRSRCASTARSVWAPTAPGVDPHSASGASTLPESG